jgi:excisionase family DNA binding protein
MRANVNTTPRKDRYKMTRAFHGQSVNIEQPDILRTPPGAAKQHGLSESFLRKVIREGRGPSYSKIGNRFLIRDSDMLAWLATKRVA